MGFRMKSEKLRFRKANHRAINIFENQTSVQEVNFRLMCQITKNLIFAQLLTHPQLPANQPLAPNRG